MQSCGQWKKIINLIVTPFRGIINDIIRRINPFGFIDKLLSQISSPLNLLPDPNTLISHLDILEVIGESTSFVPVKDYFTQGVAIVLRGLYGIMSGVLLQCSSSVQVFEQMMRDEGFAELENLLDEMQKEYPFITMSHLILDITLF